MGIKKLITLKENTPMGEMRISKYSFKHKRPTAVHFETKNWEEVSRLEKKAIEKYFLVQDYNGEISEGAIFEVSEQKADAVQARENSEVEKEKLKEEEYKATMESGDPKKLATFLEKYGENSVKAETLKKVVDSLGLRLHGNAGVKGMAEAIIEYSKKG